MSSPSREHLSSKILQVYVNMDTVTISKGDFLQLWELKVISVTRKQVKLNIAITRVVKIIC